MVYAAEVEGRSAEAADMKWLIRLFRKRRPAGDPDNLAVWLREEIAHLEAIERTQYGEGALSAHKAALRKLERPKLELGD